MVPARLQLRRRDIRSRTLYIRLIERLKATLRRNHEEPVLRVRNNRLLLIERRRLEPELKRHRSHRGRKQTHGQRFRIRIALKRKAALGKFPVCVKIERTSAGVVFRNAGHLRRWQPERKARLRSRQARLLWRSCDVIRARARYTPVVLPHAKVLHRSIQRSRAFWVVPHKKRRNDAARKCKDRCHGVGDAIHEELHLRVAVIIVLLERCTNRQLVPVVRKPGFRRSDALRLRSVVRLNVSIDRISFQVDAQVVVRIALVKHRTRKGGVDGTSRAFRPHLKRSKPVVVHDVRCIEHFNRLRTVKAKRTRPRVQPVELAFQDDVVDID